ncbi:SRPBCC family protein [Nesterenkonia ebinurensis]|uniref:SRPBCC family protein n=1 Tax=Nesterenkonia ebinurensis TaxID=2608252 RepID=UPI00123C91D0|nr:SRPBCC domain-containing protein [Nesterenkonia ebinurensis]
MILQVFRKTHEHIFERTYTAPIADVWQAWTQPELLRQWWGPEKTTIPECEVDLRVGGRLRIVMEAGAEMGRYAGTRWPLEGTFTHVDEPHRLVYEARSWTEGEEAATIDHVNEIVLSARGSHTVVNLRIHVTKIGSGVKARLAAYGMKWGYNAQLDKLDTLLSSPRKEA